MTNAPENYEAWVLPEGVEKVSYTPKVKLETFGTFTLEREDHTMGNLLRMQLLRDPNVLFVGYRHPHPIKHHILLTVQTAKVGRSESISYTPHSALRTALQDLGTEIAHLSEQVKSAM